MATEPIQVGVHNFKPLAYEVKDTWVGLEIDLWDAIAENLKLDYDFIEYEDFSHLLEDTSEGELDVAIAGITRTTKRAEKLDMSYFTLDTGLGIATVSSSSFSLKDLLKSLFSKQTLTILAVLIVFSGILANVYWWLEAGESVAEEYGEGVFEAFWWSIVTFSTVGYGDIFPATLNGRIFGVFAILSGLAIFGLYIGQLSASLAMVKLNAKINSPDDLAGKKVGVKKNTTAVEAVKKHKGKVVEFDTLEEIYPKVKKGELDAVVGDMPVLKAVAKEKGLIITGQAFSRQAYSFVFPKNTKLMKDINMEIIKLRESGKYDEIYNKYFED